MVIKGTKIVRDENTDRESLIINAMLDKSEESQIEVKYRVTVEDVQNCKNKIDEAQSISNKLKIPVITVVQSNSDLPEWVECYLNKEIPEYISGNGREVLSDNYMGLRHKVVSKVGFVLLTWEMLRHLKSDLMKYCETYLGKRREDGYRINILELGCGVGSFAFALRQLGINVIAVDDYSRVTCAGEYGVGFDYDRDAWIPDIINMDNEAAVRKYGKDVDFILISWPEYLSDSAYKSLLAMREVNPNACMIYVGERAGGCTADDDFFENVKYVKYNGELSVIEFGNWFAKTQECFRTWYGIYDSVYLVK